MPYDEKVYFVGLRPSIIIKPRNKWMLEVNLGHFGFGAITQELPNGENNNMRYRGNFQEIRYAQVSSIWLLDFNKSNR